MTIWKHKENNSFFSGIGKIVIVAAIAISVVFLFALMGSIIGAMVGWIISLTPLKWWIIDGFSQFGIKITDIITVGAMLGFIAGFFQHFNTKKD